MKYTWWPVVFGIATFASAVLIADASAQRPKTFEQTLRKFEVRFEPSEAKPGQTVTLKITLDPIDGFYTYPTVQPDPLAKSSANHIYFPAPSSVIFVGPFVDPADPKKKTETEDMNQQVLYYPSSVTWERKAVVSPHASPGLLTVNLKSPEGMETHFQVCDQSNCFNSRGTVFAKLTVLAGEPVAIDSKYKEEVDNILRLTPPPKIHSPETKKENSGPNTASPTNGDKKQVALKIPKDRDYALDIEAVKAMLPKVQTSNAGFLAFVLTAMFWGAVTLLTPCVFPMVPITVSFFLKQGEKKQHNPLTMAAVYTLTIVVVLSVAALFFLTTFRNLSVNPWMNAALGLLFVAFALSLFGMFDLVLPSKLVRFTSAREGKGGYGGVIFMALSFSIVSFTCVAPFLGGFAGLVASGNFSDFQLLAGAVAFASTFAAPFFLLALFPTLLKKLPKSGSWMNTIKVVMGFLELAAALKFFRNAELRWTIPPVFFTYDLVLSAWIIMMLVTGLYLLNLFRLPHDEPQEHIGVTRMLVGLMSISVGLYLLPGLFALNNHEKQRPGGTIYAWVDAFLLPEPSASEVVGGGELAWSADVRRALEEARATGAVVLVDFTGVTCTNCKLNEKNVFPKPDVKDLLKKFRLVQVYTDTIPPEFYEAEPGNTKRDQDAATNSKFQMQAFGTEQLPLYVLLKPDAGMKGGPVQILGIYDEGKINEDRKFVDFLKKGIVK